MRAPVEVENLCVAPVPGYGAGHRVRYRERPFLRPGIRTSCHYGQEIGSSSIRKTGGSALGATNVT
jgi:hypothetical protein